MNRGVIMRSYLKKIREKNKFTQQEVSKKLDISESYYCLIENGERQKQLSLAFFISSLP